MIRVVPTAYETGVPSEDLGRCISLRYRFAARPIGRVVSQELIPEGMIEGDTALFKKFSFSRVPLYEIRKSETVRDLNPDETRVEDRVDWQFSSDDAYVLFSRYEQKPGITWQTIVLGHEGEVRFAYERFRGKLEPRLLDSEGERIGIMPAHVGAALALWVCRNTMEIEQENLLLGENSNFWGLARDIWAHSLLLEQRVPVLASDAQ